MLTRVFSPVRIGSLRLPHRVVMGSMHLNLEHDPPALAAFYRERAEGGAGLIVTGGAGVDRAGAGSPEYLVLSEPGAWDALEPALHAVHQAGALLALQLFHAGRYAMGVTPVAPSAVFSRFSRQTPAAMTEEQIQQTIAAFAAAAATALRRGFDAVEVMGSEGYLINQFASPLTNLRDDAWGGDEDRRAAFPLAVLAAVRAAVGADFPVIVRTSGADFVDGSSTPEQSADLALRLAGGGADALNIGIGWHESSVPSVQSLVPHGMWLDIAGGIRRRIAQAGLDVPVIGSNRVNSLPLAEQALARGDVDLVSMSRPFLADARLVATSRDGDLDLVNECIACNQACIDRSLGVERVSCLVNPRAGRELEFPLLVRGPEPRSPRVAVVGAGPAGMQAAATLAATGAPVDLVEASDSIGGQFLLAGQVPGKEDYLATVRYFRHELARLGVRIRTGAAPSAADLADHAHVIVATGVRPRRVALPGAGALPVLDYQEAFAAPWRVGRRVAVIGAGGIAVDLAHLLVEGVGLGGPDGVQGRGGDHADSRTAERARFRREAGLDQPHAGAPAREITLLRRGRHIGEGIGPSTRWAVLQAIRIAGVRSRTGVEYRRITPDGLVVADADGVEEVIPADTIVVAAGQEPHAPLAAELAALGIPHTVIGGALDASGLNAVRAFEQGLRAGTAVAAGLAVRLAAP
ncbi:FAD-dependent oxidoreductase [Cellulomonas cellasea]|uniref:oxidoreductase n=1 Tax=Cellulomonas cellasea TaxID=43670 RepID=UPI0025A364E5|nr:FAD-dependent oxidoreductase [Cellulomonas cellasea]MDM8084587.1 FAD-dependent oxidoreductase [Cellulomonas cellasea]